MKTSLLSIPTDTVALDDVFHQPDGPAAGAALLLHGNTMNFYQGAPRFLPPALTRMGYACLAFNRCGHDILGIRDSRAAEGAAFQTGKGKELMLLPGWWYATSAASFLDALESCPDLLELAPRIRCPVLYLRGDQEPADLYPAEAFAQRCGGPCTVRIVPDCGHFYAGREQAVTELVASWLAETRTRSFHGPDSG